MEHRGLIYLDNAATSFPKPTEVYTEVIRAMMQYGGNAGRGTHRLSMEAAQKVYECRERGAKLFGASSPERVFFTYNTTHGLNTVIKGALRQGDHVLISDMEHNAVYRPIYKLAREGRISYSVFGSFPYETKERDERICSDILRKIRRNTRMLICVHSSNICSLTMPIEKIGELCRRCGVIFVVDGAQSAGRMPIDLGRMKIDALCVPGHKGLYGTQGSGIVALGENIHLDTLTEGGNGVRSLEGEMPDFSPERYEAGTLAVPSIAGLCEGIRFVGDVGENNIAAKETALFERAVEKLLSVNGVTVYLPRITGSNLLFNVDGVSADDVGAELDKRGICVRSGYHCAALAHRTLRTEDTGAVRASFSAFNDNDDVDALCEALRDISASR